MDQCFATFYDDLIKMRILRSLCDSLQEQVVTTPGNAKVLCYHLKDLFHDSKDARAINLDNELRAIKIGKMTESSFNDQTDASSTFESSYSSPTILMASSSNDTKGLAPALYSSQPTSLPSTFSTMLLQDPTWNMDSDEVYLAFGRHLEEIRVTCAHLEKNGQDYEPTPTSLKNFYSEARDDITDYT
ncbi:hypothetical protein Tco_1438890 [Tanacetum coccineum]